MSETTYIDIRAALTARLKAMVGIPDVAWENKTYTPSITPPYLIPTILWAESAQAEQGANGRNWERGIYQITMVYPVGVGAGDYNLMAGKIQQQFKRGTVLMYNGVTVTVRKVSMGHPNSEPSLNGVSVPISISFYSQVAN